MSPLSWLIALTPLWWLLGADILVYPVVLGWLAVSRGIKPRWDLVSLSVAGCVLVFTVRSYLALWEGAGIQRVVAAMYNVLVLGTGLMVYWQARSLEDWSRFLVASARLFWTCAAVSAVLFLWSLISPTPLVIPTLLGLILPGDSGGIVNDAKQATFYGTDWFWSDLPLARLDILGPYPNATAITLCALGYFAMFRTRERAGLVGLIFCLTFLMIAFTLSRSVMAAMMLGLVASLLVFGTWRLRAIAVTAIALTGLAMLFSSGPDRFVDFLSATRSASTSERAGNYVLALESTWQSHPFIGLGVKDRDENIQDIPIGSHSTLVSSYVKGGVLGLLAMILAFYVAPLVWWFGLSRRPSPGLGILFGMQVVVWVWLAFEDVDAPMTGAVMVFLFLGLVAHLHQTLTEETDEKQSHLLGRHGLLQHPALYQAGGGERSP